MFLFLSQIFPLTGRFSIACSLRIAQESSQEENGRQRFGPTNDTSDLKENKKH